MLSAALQIGNASISSQGTSDMLLHAYRDTSESHGAMHTGGPGRGPGRNHQRRTAAELRHTAASDEGFGSIVHADYHAARIGVGRRSASAA